jgi:type I restriction enzyme, R subunit
LPFFDSLECERREGAATDIAAAVEEYAGVVDWQNKQDVQRLMRRAIKERLRSAGMDGSVIEAVTAKVMGVARAWAER